LLVLQCDIAVRALSPGVNDPFTATQCMDVLTSLLATLATMPLGVPHVRDSKGRIRLCAPRRSFSYLLAMLDSIRRYGGSDLSVCRRALRLFGDLGMILPQVGRVDAIPTVLVQMEQWMRVARQNFNEESSEIKSLEELYDHIRISIAESDKIVVRDESGVKDLQDWETTYCEEKKGSGDEENGMEVVDPSQRTIVSEFLSRVNWGSSTR